MWELCMHLDYDLLYIPLTSKYHNFQPQVIIFCKKRLLLCGSRFLKKKTSFFWFEILLFRQAKRKKLILPPKKYFKPLKDMIIGTAST